MELHGVIGRERNVQSLVQEFPQRVLRIFQKQAVVAKRRHGNGNLSKVVEILQYWTLQKNRHTHVIHAEHREGQEKHSSTETRGWVVSVQVPNQV
jgi:hypothetical protein